MVSVSTRFVDIQCSINNLTGCSVFSQKVQRNIFKIFKACDIKRCPSSIVLRHEHLEKFNLRVFISREKINKLCKSASRDDREKTAPMHEFLFVKRYRDVDLLLLRFH
jgi:hypothetical protein